jgi:hypothetical protein
MVASTRARLTSMESSYLRKLRCRKDQCPPSRCRIHSVLLGAEVLTVGAKPSHKSCPVPGLTEMLPPGPAPEATGGTSPVSTEMTGRSSGVGKLCATGATRDGWAHSQSRGTTISRTTGAASTREKPKRMCGIFFIAEIYLQAWGLRRKTGSFSCPVVKVPRPDPSRLRPRS